jgi:hypothetical protein
MNGAAQPISFKYSRKSLQNGVITNYNFTVINMNYLIDGDRLVIDLPYPVFATEKTQCLGLTKNLLNI